MRFLRRRATPFRMAWAMMVLAIAGWKPRAGYTIMEAENDGSLYFALWLDPPKERPR